MILTNVRTYARGFIDATLLGTAICFGVAYWEQKEKNDILQDRVDEQSQLIQRFGWPKNKNKSSYKSYSKIPKGKPVSRKKPENPIGFY